MLLHIPGLVPWYRQNVDTKLTISAQCLLGDESILGHPIPTRFARIHRIPVDHRRVKFLKEELKIELQYSGKNLAPLLGPDCW